MLGDELRVLVLDHVTVAEGEDDTLLKLEAEQLEEPLSLTVTDLEKEGE